MKYTVTVTRGDGQKQMEETGDQLDVIDTVLFVLRALEDGSDFAATLEIDLAPETQEEVAGLHELFG